MTNSKKYAWTHMVKDQFLEEYVRLHREAWPEIMQAYREAGIRNYSIFQSGNQFFYCFECEDVSGVFAYLEENEVCNRWNALTYGMIEGSFDGRRKQPAEELEEIFYLP